ncbi:MAG: TetR/AcrR family transcriptional regulator [Chloroflexi bacterium]|nr:TetR/AcrR family transcriptional regulator [Chloroflexota bacterium]
MTKKRGAPSKRDSILYAAGQVVISEGAGQLTLDSVAEKAGVSKGGLLYHFPTKDALISELLSAYLGAFDAQIGDYIAGDTESKAGRFLRAYVRTSFTDTRPDPGLAAAALAAITARPELLQKVRDKYAEWQSRALSDEIPIETALTVMLATDGIWCAELLGIEPLKSDQRALLQTALLRLLKG